MKYFSKGDMKHTLSRAKILDITFTITINHTLSLIIVETLVSDSFFSIN